MKTRERVVVHKQVSFWISLVVFIIGILIFSVAGTNLVANSIGLLIILFGGFWLYCNLDVIPPKG